MNTTPPLPSPERQTPKDDHRMASSASMWICLFAIGLLTSFFLPWIHIGQVLSGFHLQKIGGIHRWLWLIPVFSSLTILAAKSNRCQKIFAQLSGVFPFVVLAYWLNQLGGELLRHLSIGAWLSLICGLALLILPHRHK